MRPAPGYKRHNPFAFYNPARGGRCVEGVEGKKEKDCSLVVGYPRGWRRASLLGKYPDEYSGSEGWGWPDELLGKLRPGVDGVVLRAGKKYSSVYLPQVWKQIPDKTQFMNRLASKAGLPEGTWRQDNVTILTFQVEAFGESEL